MRYLNARLRRRMRSALVALIFGFFSAPLARSNNQSKPNVQFVYFRTVRLPFAMDAPPRKNIYTSTTENMDEKQLTTDGHSFSPVLSPDGTRIAYLHVTADTCEHCLVSAKYEINVMNADGSEPHTVAAVDGPVMLSWSPDGRTLVYGASAAWSDGLVPDQYDPGTLSKIFSASHPLYLIHPDSDAPPLLLADNAAVSFVQPKWSPDGKWLAYGCHNPQSGKRPGVCLLRAGERAEPKFVEGADALRFSWSPDSTKMVYSAFAPRANKDRKAFNMFLVRTDDLAPRLLTTFNGACDPQWSPDGLKIVFCDREKGKSVIHTISADGRAELRLTDPKRNATHPLWSADGKLIIFSAPLHDKLQTYLVNADGSQVRALTGDRKLSCENLRWLQNTSLVLLLCGRAATLFGVQSIADGDYYILSVDDPAGTPRKVAKQGSTAISFAIHDKKN